jgi:hypothetical protein
MIGGQAGNAIESAGKGGELTMIGRAGPGSISPDAGDFVDGKGSNQWDLSTAIIPPD